MSQFRSKLILEDDGGFPLIVASPFVYDSDLLKRTITVPAEFPTDLASIPRILWNILPPVGCYDRAAVLHDFLYRYGGCTRAEADGVLNEAMTVCNVPAHRRFTIYYAVRVGGWKPWNAYRAAEKK